METTFYEDEGAKVTNARFMTNGETHALSGITSVSEYVQNPNRIWSILCGLIGVLLLLTRFYWYGAALIVLTVIIHMTQEAKYVVLIRTSAGELKALTDTNGKRVAAIVQALNDAIVYRG